MKGWHISRSWGADRFAPGCGCTLLPCGCVEADEVPTCPQHGLNAARTLRQVHAPKDCPRTVSM